MVLVTLDAVTIVTYTKMSIAAILKVRYRCKTHLHQIIINVPMNG